MRNLMVRGRSNPIIYEMHDFSLGLYTKDAELIAEGLEFLPFWGPLTFAIKDMVRYVGEENLEEGDVILSTFPYFIGAHPQDATPGAADIRRRPPVRLYLRKSHWLDLGAKDIYSTDTTDVFQEGFEALRGQAGRVPASSIGKSRRSFAPTPVRPRRSWAT